MNDLRKDYRGNNQTTAVYDLQVDNDVTIAGALTVTGALDLAGGVAVAGLLEAEAGFKALGGFKYTTTGGSATEVASIADKNIEAGDIIIATLSDDGAGDETLLTAKVTDDDEVTFVFASDPSNDTVVDCLVVKA